MRILLIGSGGREHALAWKLAQSPRLARLFAAPGNPGIAEHAKLVALNLQDHGAVVAFCAAERIDLVVVGPEGGLTPDELSAFRSAGGQLVSLGDGVLRTSSAGVVALAQLQVLAELRTQDHG